MSSCHSKYLVLQILLTKDRRNYNLSSFILGRVCSGGLCMNIEKIQYMPYIVMIACIGRYSNAILHALILPALCILDSYFILVLGVYRYSALKWVKWYR